MKLNINGTSHTVDVDPEMPLLWVLRDVLGMTGTKFGCGVAQCGACTVLVDGTPVRSCSLPAGSLSGEQVRTIEAATDKGQRVAAAVLAAWDEAQVAQCGYCQPGQIMAATALLEGNASPGDADIDNAMAGNACRCATYVRIRAAIHDAARRLGA
ncbi:(2Fe-2S)-binding protein [Novosphingobium sp. CECT 9465]|uniref:(2Fe-2S)-binding protein n=1 Tax=Novosphingobium sp. CECT 9465 TaxID=2829794 RepID=UPI001E324671|nr:(2Fe-2S)-binding protein [Novosphingobium sp. CECT 9465]CAH0495254.1 Isoquinoline 1-oxidoreductase subunit alpha [Novosphingobium sp. CECT 9465]